MKIKDLKEEHPRIYKRALECQVEQGNEKNDELELCDSSYSNNFDWSKTKEGSDIWKNVNLELFDSWYKFHEIKFPRRMLVWVNHEDEAINRLVIAKYDGYYIAINGLKGDDDVSNGVIAWENAKEIEETEEMTLEEVCKELGRNIKIVK